MSKPIKLAMLIDDAEIDQRLYRRILEKSGLVQVVNCFTYADDALDYLLENPELEVSVIFLDINMPRMNGFEFLETYQAKTQKTPVIIMLTSSDQAADREKCTSYSMVAGYETKPVSVQILEQLERMLSSKQQQAD